MNNSQITLAQIFAAVMRHKFKSFFVFFLVMLLVTAAFLILPRKYGSEGKLFVQLGGRNNSSLDPTSGSASVTIQDSRETTVRSVAELVSSRAILEAVVDEIGIEEILKSPLDKYIPEIELPEMPWASKGEDGALSKEEYNRFKSREQATRKIENNLSVKTEKKTSVISVYCKANSAELAQKIVDSIMRLTKKKHLEVHAIQGSSRFFDEEFKVHEKRLVDAIKAQQKFRTENEFLSVYGARDTLQGIMSRLENERIDAEVSLDTANEKVAQYRQEMTEIKNVVSIPKTGVEKLSFEDSRTELFKVESDYARASSLYKADHPEVVRLGNQVKELKSKLENMTTERTEFVSELNPVFEKIKVNFINATVERDAASAKVDSINKKFDEASAEMVRLNKILIDSDQLERDVSIAREYLALFTQKRGQSRVLDDMDKMNISEVVVAQPANFVVKHVSPKGSLMIPLGFAIALLTALAAALFLERNHLSGALGEEEVEQILDLPVLVTLPRVYSSANMVN